MKLTTEKTESRPLPVQRYPEETNTREQHTGLAAHPNPHCTNLQNVQPRPMAIYVTQPVPSDPIIPELEVARPVFKT